MAVCFKSLVRFQRPDGYYPVYIRVTHKRKVHYIKTDKIVDLLTECYGIIEGANRCYSVVLAPAQHPTTEKEVASLRNELKPEFRNKISAISLEDFITKTLEVCPDENKSPFKYFKERYIP